MRQRVIVQALIRKGSDILVLRRAQGQSTVVGKYELPGGRLGKDEQPGDSLKRHILSDTGLIIDSLELIDLVSSIDRDETPGGVQNVLAVYSTETSSASSKVVIAPKYDKYEWLSLPSVKKLTLRSSAAAALDITLYKSNKEVKQALTDEVLPVYEPDITAPTAKNVIIYSDGGSRGNPGPSSAGFVIMDQDEQVIDQGGIYLGITTNNQAEYHGVRLALERALEMGARTVDARVDSLLVANQLKGVYAIKSRDLWPINERIRELIAKFDKVTFMHVPRELNQLADGMVNKILDNHKANSAQTHDGL